MIEKIQQVEDNWQKPWITIAANTRNFFPQNLTGRRYTGGNAFLLLFLCEKFQYQTPVFMTFNQAKEAGISVLKGSKSFPVYYFLFYVYHKETRKKITFEEYKALSREQQQEYNVIPTYKYYSVFNLDQTNFSDVRPEEWEALREKFRGGQAEQPEIDAMLEAKSWFCPIREQQGDRAFYSPLADYIVVPLRSQFVDMQSFYETLLHEMGHSTGHPTRLNRDLAHPFGSEEYGNVRKNILKRMKKTILLPNHVSLIFRLRMEILWFGYWKAFRTFIKRESCCIIVYSATPIIREKIR